MKKRHFKGILFDFDGVLARTLEDHYNAWKLAMMDFGINIKEEDYYPLEGTNLRDVAKILCDKYNVKVRSYDDVVKKKVSYYLKSHSFKFYPGVKKLINILATNKVPKAIVSASTHEQLSKTVGKSFLDKFESVISGDKVKKGKPHPESYLKGAEELRLNPIDCIAVENAPLGITSAKRAGMYCIAICSTTSKENLSHADVVVDKFSKLSSVEAIKALITNN